MISLLSFVLALCLSGVAFGQAERTETLLSQSWRFEKSDPAGAEQPGFDDSSWRIVTVPHDWTIEDLAGQNHPFDPDAIGGFDVGYTVGGTAWYRKSFTLDASDAGKIVHLEFGGVYMNSDVWVNGTHVGNRPYGYSTFWFDVTDYVNFGTETVVAVQVKNEGKNSRWYSGSGIYRPVTLTLMDPVHVVHWGPFVTTPTVSTSLADVNVATEVKNESDSSETVTFESTILDSNSNIVATDSTSVSISSGGSYEFDQTMAVSNPDLWSMDSPTLYTMSQDVIVGGQTVDHVETSFGIRSISFSATEGFKLNEQSVLLQGACMHHDNYMLGAAAYDRAEERRVEAIKDAGFNAIRTAHNPPSRAFLDTCDRLGILVIDEAFDTWTQEKWDHVDDYSKYFANWWDQDLDSMVLRDRNHASIIVWSIGNEIPEQGDSGAATAEMLTNYIWVLDSTRPVTVAANKAGSGMDLYFSKVDIAGYNYRPGNYLSDHARVPDRVIWGSESYARDAFSYWDYAANYTYIIGDFVWTAYDYLGEAGIGFTGYGPGWNKLGSYPWHAAYCGDIDLTAYKRPAAYYRQVLWKTGKNKVSAFVLSPVDSLPEERGGGWKKYWVYPDIHPSWTWPGYEGEALEVTVYSECEEVELFLNSQSLGTQVTNIGTEYKATYSVNYQPGELKAVGYIGGMQEAEWVLQTAGTPAEIQLAADRSTITADGLDLCYVTAELFDASGNRVYDWNEDILLSFDVQGAGTLAGVGNANPYGTESFEGPDRTTFRGRCVAVLRSTQTTGTATVTVTSAGLTPDSVVIQTTGGAGDDTTPPTPDPMTWATVPYATGPYSIAMVATTASDPSGVEYYFTCVSGGGQDSGWQDDTYYQDTGLNPETQYCYTIKARDKSPAQNETAASGSACATTEQEPPPDTTPPSPDPMTFASLPAATGSSSIEMTATTATDESGVEYYFTCASGGGNDSGWQDETYYEDSGLNPETQYCYTVKARDKSINQNETLASGSECATTSGSAALIDDDFEGTLANWSTDWDLVTTYYVSSSHSVECSSEDNDLISIDLDTSGASSISITFKYRVDGIDNNDNIVVQYYNGTDYITIDEIGDDAEDTWLTYSDTITDSQYFKSNFRLKIEGTAIDPAEYLWIDDVLITME